jgi:hypothetical protein
MIRDGRAMWEAKIRRAKQHRSALQVEVNRFFAKNPYEVGFKRDPQTDRGIYYLKSVKEVPEQISLIAGDIIQSLRSALDHLAFHLFVMNSGSAASAKHVYFPIASDLAKYESTKAAKTRGMSMVALGLIDEVMPYREGNQRLWQLHELNIIDKHRLLVTAGSAYSSFDVGSVLVRELQKADSSPTIGVPELSLFLRPADKLFPLATGDELFADLPGAQPDSKIQFRFEVSLSEPGLVEGEQLSDTVDDMIKAVEDLVPIFKRA